MQGSRFPEGLLPHQGPALLLDQVLSRSASRAEAAASIPANHPYIASGVVESALALELFAQTAALVSAPGSGPPRRGRLAAVPELELLEEFLAVGSDLTVTVERQGDHGSLTRFSGLLTASGRPIARGVVVVALTSDDAPAPEVGAAQ